MSDEIDWNALRQKAIDGAAKIIDGNRVFDADGGDLSERMHSRVGTAGTRHMYAMALDGTDDFFERALNGRQTRLHLPAVEIGTVVGDFKAESPWAT